MQLNIVEKTAGGRQEPRHREAGRRKDGTTHDPRTPRKGRLRPGKLQLNPIRCSFHLLPSLVHRKGTPVRDPNAAESPAGGRQAPRHRDAGRREDGTSRPQHTAEGPSRPGLFILHMVQRSWPRSRNQMLRIRGKVACVCRSSGSTRPHTDAATTLRVCILVEYSVTLAVLDFFVQEKGKHHGNITEMVK